MTDKNFKRLLEKYQSGNCTPEEKKLVEQWYASFEQEEDGIGQLSEPRKAALEEKMMEQIRNRMPFPATGKAFPLAAYLSIAAAALLLLFFGFYFRTLLPASQENHDWLTLESKDQIRKVILPDGTLIWLKGTSQLRYPRELGTGNNVRRVTLTGEALLEVAKNPQKPFLIQCGKFEAKVLGTSFNIKQAETKQQVEIVVLTGKVALSNSNSKETQAKTIIVEPMEQAIARSDGFTKRKVRTLANYTEGTTYNMQFDEAPLQDVLQRIEQKFEVSIMYDNVATDCRITADFTDQSLENTLRMLAATLGEIRYQLNGNKVLLEGKACQ